MKLAKLCDLLSVIADVVRPQSAAASDDLVRIARALRPFGKRDVAELWALSGDVEPAESTDGSGAMSAALEGLAFVEPLMERVAAPQPKQVFRLLKALLTKHSQMSVNVFVRSISETLAPNAPIPNDDQSLESAYVAALHQAQHDVEEFPLVYGALIADPRLSKDDIVEIASRFAYQMAKSTSKKTALERIWKVHDASQAYADKAMAMKGRSAG